MTLTVGSFFSGVDGLAIGVERALGAETIWQSEIDPHASTVLAARFPGASNLGDINQVDWATVETPDVLVGGPPCQPVSQAGRRKGSADDRWLWPAALNAVSALRPPLVLFENPMGLMTGRDDDDEAPPDSAPHPDGMGGAAADDAGGGWFGTVLWSLAEMGYLGRYGCLRSCCTCGAPHQRRRVFIAAAPTDPRSARTGRHPRPVSRTATALRRPGPELRPPLDGGAVDANTTASGRGPGDAEPGVGGFPDGERDTQHRGRRRPHADANEQRPQGAEPAQRPLVPSRRGGVATHAESDRQPGDGPARDRWPGPAHHGPASSYPDGKRFPHGTEPDSEPGCGLGAPRRGDPGGCGEHADWGAFYGRYEPAVRRWEPIHGPAPAPRDNFGRLNPELAEWMLGFPPGWVTDPALGLPRTAQLRLLGNSCQPQVAELAARLLLVPLMTETAAA